MRLRISTTEKGQIDGIFHEDGTPLHEKLVISRIQLDASPDTGFHPKVTLRVQDRFEGVDLVLCAGMTVEDFQAEIDRVIHRIDMIEHHARNSREFYRDQDPPAAGPTGEA